jgi:hypothetical protein
MEMQCLVSWSSVILVVSVKLHLMLDYHRMIYIFLSIILTFKDTMEWSGELNVYKAIADLRY